MRCLIATRRIGAAALVLLGAVACYEDEHFAVADAPVYRAYAADFVYHCPVPFFYETAGTTHIYEGADLVLRMNGGAEIAFYSRMGSGDYAGNWTADTLRVAGTYERDGFTLRFRFDEGYAGRVPMEAELVEGGRVLAAFPDGGQMEFVPLDERPGGEPEHCQP